MADTTSTPAGAPRAAASTWWREGVLYQVYPRSFADSDGDGVGDLRGIVARLDHLAWLGVDGIWLNPTFPSPNRDWGYDVADYCGVDPALGTLEDLDALVVEARARGIAVLLDLVPNHTSDRHAWFQDALTGRDARFRDFYVWADPGPGGGPPNNWMSNFADCAWTLDEASGQYYLHNFLAEQPDLNWWNEEVREAFDDVLRFWYERGVAGFRIDVCHAIVKDRELRDNPPAGPHDHPHTRRRGQVQEFSANRPEVHDVLKRWRALTDGFGDPARVLVGETFVLDLDQLLPYYGNGDDQLHLAFNFLFVHAPLEADALRRLVEEVTERLPAPAWPVWTGSNHDVGRLATRWAGGDEDRTRCALLMLLTLRGTPFLYYGDEIGLGEVPVPRSRMQDPVGKAPGDHRRNRDGERTPMHWSPAPGAGFTPPGVEPWLPLGDAPACNVADQKEDPASILWLVRDLIALRRAEEDLRRGDYASLPAPEGVWAFARGDGFAVALNLGEAAAEVPGLAGTIAIATRRARDGEAVAELLRLDAGEAAVVRLAGAG